MSTTRGRRPGGPDTRGEILDAARESFARKGFGGTTIRAVAASAGVDPALVHHYFGSKDDLFLAALEVRVDPREVLPEVLAPGIEGAGERMVRLFLSVYDNPDHRLPLLAVIRSSLGADGDVSLLRDGVFRIVFSPLREMLPGPDVETRLQMLASQMLGVIVLRYVARLEPVASMPADELVRWLAPTLQRYLGGDPADPP